MRSLETALSTILVIAVLSGGGQAVSDEEAELNFYKDLRGLRRLVRMTIRLRKNALPTGDCCDDRYKELQSELSSLKSSLQKVDMSSGSVYTRWGRGSCSDNSATIYSGYIGGTLYTQQSGGSNSLCLTSDPKLTDQRKGQTPLVSNLYGTRYQVSTSSSTGSSKIAACAVCSTRGKMALMIPGTNKCPAGWGSEYAGRLMSVHVSQTMHLDHICVDSAMDTYPRNGTRSDTVRLLYYTITRCDTLLCPPYDNNYFLPCVVCSK